MIAATRCDGRCSPRPDDGTTHSARRTAPHADEAAAVPIVSSPMPYRRFIHFHRISHFLACGSRRLCQMIAEALKNARVLTVATTPINTMDPSQQVMLAPLMAVTGGSAHVVIGLIDGPVAKDHPGLVGARLRELASTPNERCSLVSSAACRHGTAVAGMLCASRQFLPSAICPGCTLLVRPIFGTTGNETGGVPNAEPEALAGAISDCIDAGAAVLNLSVSLGDASRNAADTLSEALSYAARRGVLVVAAAGNDGTIYSSAITRHPWVIPVTACGRADVPLGTSNLSSSVGRRGLPPRHRGGRHVMRLASVPAVGNLPGVHIAGAPDLQREWQRDGGCAQCRAGSARWRDQRLHRRRRFCTQLERLARRCVEECR